MTEPPLSADALGVITLRAPTIYEHADQAYFMRELNSFRHKFFVRFRTSKDEREAHAWSRLIEVRYIHADPAGGPQGADDATGSAALAPGGSAAEDVDGTQLCTPHVMDYDGLSQGAQPSDGNGPPSRLPKGGCIQWRQKRFLVCLVVEGFDKPVHLPRVSASLPTEAEVREYCARAANAAEDATPPPLPPLPPILGDGATATSTVVVGGGAVPAIDPFSAQVPELEGLRKYLPSPEVVAEMRQFKEARLIRRQWSATDFGDAMEKNEALHRNSVGSLTTRSAVAAVEKMKFETELGISSSFHMTGHSAASLETRPGDFIGSAAVQRRTPSSYFSPQSRRNRTGPLSSQSGGELVPKDDGDFSQQASGSLMRSDSILSQSQPQSGSPIDIDTASTQRLQQYVEQAIQDEKHFYEYVSHEERSMYLNKVADITLKNALVNRKTRLLGIANEKKLMRTGNLLESGGLWIMDDHRRAQKAQQFKKEQDVDTVQKGGPASKDAKAAVGDRGAQTASETTADIEESAQTRALRAEKEAVVELANMHRSQALNFDSVPDEFFSLTPVSHHRRSLGPNWDGQSLSTISRTSSITSSSPPPALPLRASPNMLRKGTRASAQLVVHASVFEAVKRHRSE